MWSMHFHFSGQDFQKCWLFFQQHFWKSCPLKWKCMLHIIIMLIYYIQITKRCVTNWQWSEKYVAFFSDDEVSQHMSEILPENYKLDIYLSRKSQDKILNSQGRELLNLCASDQLRMLNGSYVGDILGNMTCFNSKRL
jgi:hypothetical protein